MASFAATETQCTPASAADRRFEVHLARGHDEVMETQRLRYRVFADEMGADIDGGDEGLDRDGFDAHCRHLLVRDTASGEVVACTRLLSDSGAGGAGGFYSAGEFDLGMLYGLPGRVLEVGRTCVDARYRGGAVIAVLWQGIAEIIVGEGFDYLFGCASIGLDDGGAQAHAIVGTLRDKHMSAPWQRVRPLNPLPLADARPTASVRMPPLLKAYVSLGAKACGEPYWDRDFNCADVFMLLDVRDLNPRYARHFLKREMPTARGRLAA